MPVSAEPDIFQRFEREVRTPRRRLLVDSLLPPPESIESAVTPPPPPPPLPGEPPDEARLFARLETQDTEPEEEKPKPRRKVAAAVKKKKVEEKPKSLQEEIEEFMSRGGALAPDADIGPFEPPPHKPADPQARPKTEAAQQTEAIPEPDPEK